MCVALVVFRQLYRIATSPSPPLVLLFSVEGLWVEQGRWSYGLLDSLGVQRATAKEYTSLESKICMKIVKRKGGKHHFSNRFCRVIHCQMSSAFRGVEEIGSFKLKIFSLLWSFIHLIPLLE